jgi:RNA polymerase sigma factor (sigma-70 family)
MTPKSLGEVLGYLRRTCAAQGASDLTDGELLQGFLTRREDAAFTILLQRHGPMVLAVCQRVLGDSHSAEDAFQATFLVLVRRAASIGKRELLSNWLYGVALRIALRARAQMAARRRRERQAKQMPRAEPLDELSCQEFRSVLDEEIGRLPDKYRFPIVLCYFEGKSYDQAAEELGCPKSSLAKRLTRARELLRRQLTQRGLTLAAAPLALFLAEKAAGASVTARLMMNTVNAAASVAAGKPPVAGYLSAAAVALVENAMKPRLSDVKTKLVLLVMAVVLAVVGAGLAAVVGMDDQTEHWPTVKPLSLKRALAGVGRHAAFGDEPRLQVLLQMGQTGRVTSVALSADGRHVVTASEDRTAILWEASSGKKLQTFQGHTDAVWSVSVSRDGKHLVTGSWDKTAILWDTSSGKKVQTFKGHTHRVRSVALCGDGKHLVTGSDDGTAILWEASSGKKLYAFH